MPAKDKPYAGEYECGEPFYIAKIEVGCGAGGGVERQREYGCGYGDLNGEAEYIDKYGGSQEAAAHAEEAGYEAQDEVDGDGVCLVKAVAVGFAALGGDAAAMQPARGYEMQVAGAGD